MKFVCKNDDCGHEWQRATVTNGVPATSATLLVDCPVCGGQDVKAVLDIDDGASGGNTDVSTVSTTLTPDASDRPLMEHGPLSHDFPAG